ncbi:MAG: bacillithiol biosynthesis BshC [Myxococcota bacterium]
MFWLQNEDHDLAEIASCRVVGPDGAPGTVSVPVPADDRRAVGPAPSERAWRSRWRSSKASSPGCRLPTRRWRCCARPTPPTRRPTPRSARSSRRCSHRTGCWCSIRATPRWSRRRGLLHAEATRRATALAEAIDARADALRAAGFDVQVHVRPGAPLSFVHPDGLDGPRYRLEPHADGFRVVGTDRVLSRDDAAALPASTSALLRPILQDRLLPTAATVCGPGEIAYHAQLPPLYAAFDLPMPLVVPRARFLLVDETADRLLAQLGLAPDALEAPRDALLSRLVRRPAGLLDPDALQAALLEPVRAALARFAVPAEELDPSLAKAVDKAEQSFAGAAERLAARYEAALRRSDGVTADRLDRLLAQLRLDAAPQERTLCWPWAAARSGPAALVDAVLGRHHPARRRAARASARDRGAGLRRSPRRRRAVLRRVARPVRRPRPGRRRGGPDPRRARHQRHPEVRAAEAADAASVLGLAARECLGLPDGGLRADDDAQVDAVVAVLRRLRPALLLAPHPDARHPDHAAAAHLVRRAAFFAGLVRHRPALGAPHRPQRILAYPDRQELRPDLVVDTTAGFERKLAAVRCHRSQLHGAPTPLTDPVGIEAWTVRDRYWGASIGVRYGEPYQVVGPVPVADPVAHFAAHPAPPALVPR